MSDFREEQRLDQQFQNYLPTLHRMTQNYPPMEHLTRQDIEWSWKQTPAVEKNGILLLAQFQEFFDQIHNKRSGADQEAVMSRDINRKRNEYFKKYTERQHQACEELVDEGEFLGHWWISQTGKTQLERDLDESQIDKVIQRDDGNFVLIQYATRQGDARDKQRHLVRRYGPKFNGTQFIGIVTMREPSGGDWTMEELKNELVSVAYNTPGFGPNILASVFPSKR